MFFLFYSVAVSRWDFCSLWWLIIGICLLKFFFSLVCLFCLVSVFHFRDFISCLKIFANFGLSGLDTLSAWIRLVDFELHHWVVQGNPVGNLSVFFKFLLLNWSASSKEELLASYLEGYRCSGSPMRKEWSSQSACDLLTSLFGILNCSWLSSPSSISREETSRPPTLNFHGGGLGN